jgi:glutamyl/glutaminyl-tRNA synthetase
MRTRLAPTPSGYLHLGNVFNFILSWIRARQYGIQILLRIDDADRLRKRPEYVDDIFRVIEWLQLDYDIGPSSADDFEKNWSQIHRTPMYENLLNKLFSHPDVFACFCSRRQIIPIIEENQCTCMNKSFDTDLPHAWKINTKALWISIPDVHAGKLQIPLSPFIIRQKNYEASYQVSSLADDIHFEISHIFRGEDLLESTGRQLFLDQIIGPSSFSKAYFFHHTLVKGNDGEKLSKSAGAQRQSLMKQFCKNEIMQGFGRWMNFPEPYPNNISDWIEWMPR